MSINFYGDARGEFRNTVVGEHATMTVYESADVSVGVSLAMTLGFFMTCLVVVGGIFKTGYRLKS